MLSWWPGDGDPNDIAGSNHGTLMNGASFAAGKVAQTFSFDGVNDYVEMPENGSLDLNGDFTIDAWVNPRDLNSRIALPVVVKYDFTGGRWENVSYQLSIFPDGKVGSSVSCDRTDMELYTDPGTVLAGRFTHIAVVYRQNPVPAMQIYVDGVLRSGNAQGSCTFINRTDIPFQIGVRRDLGRVDYFDGLIDEVEVFDRALAANEIRAIYLAGTAGKCKPENNAPVAVDDTYTTPSEQPLAITAPGVLENDSDPDGDPLMALLVSNVLHGMLTLNANGSFSYVPTIGFAGIDTFTYRANDGSLDSNVATVTIAVAPPVVRNRYLPLILRH